MLGDGELHYLYESQSKETLHCLHPELTACGMWCRVETNDFFIIDLSVIFSIHHFVQKIEKNAHGVPRFESLILSNNQSKTQRNYHKRQGKVANPQV